MKRPVVDLDKADKCRIQAVMNDIAKAEAQPNFPSEALDILQKHLFNITHRDPTTVNDLPWRVLTREDRERLVALLYFIEEAEMIEYKLCSENGEDTDHDMAITRERLVKLNNQKLELLAKYA